MYSYSEPYDYDEGCEVCLTSTDDCTCDECPKCGEFGSLECYGGECSGISTEKLPEPNCLGIRLTEEQEERISALQLKLYQFKYKAVEVPTVEEFFSGMNVPEGDFSWDGEAGDDHAWCCGEKDCDVQWHKAWYTENIGRRDGKLYIEAMVCSYGDGDWQLGGVWEEGDSDEAWAEFYTWYLSGRNSDDYFKGWAQYFLDIAQSGKDVLEAFDKPVAPIHWTEECIRAAEDTIKYLKM